MNHKNDFSNIQLNLYPNETEQYKDYIKSKEYKEYLNNAINWQIGLDKNFAKEYPNRVNLPKNNKILIYTVGIPGSGKSTVGKEITKIYDFIFINAWDLYLNILLHDKKDSYISYLLLRDTFNYFNNQNRSFFLHASVRSTKTRKIVLDYAKQNNYTSISVNVRCDPQIAFNRILKRDQVSLGFDPERLVTDNPKRMADHQRSPESLAIFKEYLKTKGKTFEQATEKDYQEMHFFGNNSWSKKTTFAELELNPIEIDGNLNLTKFKKEAIQLITPRINQILSA